MGTIKVYADIDMDIRLYNGVCLLPAYFPTATTASNLFLTMTVEEK